MRFAWPEGEPRTLRAGAVASARSVNDKEVLDDSHQDALGTDIELPAGLPPTLEDPQKPLRMELGNSGRQPAGRMFWFTRKRFAGS
jgi:hypothetical protein